MRILLVSHLYPPRHGAGTERYTAELGARLAAAGHDVHVFATTKDISLADRGVVDRIHEGIPVREFVNNRFHEDFAETWRLPAAEEAFGELLDRWRPDVVHFQHLLYLSAGCLFEATRRGLPVLFTLHDFWLECPRFGQLLHADGGLCERVDFDRCGTCLTDFEWRQPPSWRRVGRAVAGVRRAVGLDLGPLARRVGSRMRRRPAVESEARAEPSPSDVSEVTDLARFARERSAELRRDVLEHVDRFISPSRFLLERLQAWGLPPERCHHLPTGIERARFHAERPARGERLRIAFLGTLVPVKGAHLLLEAWRRLTDEQRAAGELALFGPRDHAPAYVAELEREAQRVGARLGGALDRDGVAETLRRTDLLVVPSTWYENRPLVVLEALACRTPVLVSEPGGMSELVREGVTGWRFPMGDAAVLAQRLAAVLERPALLDALDFDGVELPTWEALAARTEALYRELLEARAGAGETSSSATEGAGASGVPGAPGEVEG